MSARRCLNTALALLSRRDHSRHELELKLARRGYDSSQIRAAVSECGRLNYLDDNAYCRRYADQLRRKGYGVRRIAQMLKAKGISQELMDAHLQLCGLEEEQCTDCRKMLAKKLKTLSGRTLEEKKIRSFRYLLNRGFASHIILRVLGEITWEDFSESI